MATVTDPRDIILSPVISEKSYGLIEDNVYTFIVAPDSNKTQIKIAIEKIFKVKVESVATELFETAATSVEVEAVQPPTVTTTSEPW